MKKVMATMGVMALLIGTSFAQDNVRTERIPADKRAEMKMKKEHGMMSEIPNLTEEQKTQIKKLKEEARVKSEPQRKQLKDLKMKLNELKTAENPNQQEINSLIDKSAKIKAEMDKARAASEIKVRQILTPEQLKVVDAKRKEKMEMREKKHMDHKQEKQAK